MHFDPSIIGKRIRRKLKPTQTLVVVDIFKSGRVSGHNYALCYAEGLVDGTLAITGNMEQIKANLKPHLTEFFAGLKYLDDYQTKGKHNFAWASVDAWEPAILDKSAISQILVKQYR